MTLQPERPLVKKDFPLIHMDEAQRLFGPRDQFLIAIESGLGVRLKTRESSLIIEGESASVARAEALLSVLINLIRRGETFKEMDIQYAIQLTQKGQVEELLVLFDEVLARTLRGKVIRAKTLGQKHYIATMKTKDIVFAIGPAGTGKTFLAVVFAVLALKAQTVRRLILTRPAVEAGERLGFLPGDLQEKVDPYLRPLYDALNEMMGMEAVQRAMERGVIEIAPLAYMRGRTLDESFIILDEAQNTTPEQMKMFLTRMGFGSKMIITGDLTQIDLAKGQLSGLSEAWETLSGIPEIGFISLTEQDVVRHHLVQKIIQAYEAHDTEVQYGQRR